MPKFAEMTELELIEQGRIALRDIAPSLFREMLKRGLIDPARKSDPAYLLKAFRSNTRIIDDVPVVWNLYSGFIRIAELAVDNDEPEVAIVLLATAVDHILNIYYVERLAPRGLSEKDVALMIRSLNTEAKMGWLNSLTGPLEIPDDLKKRLLALMELRNAIVHYKALPKRFSEESWIGSRVAQTNFEELNDDVDSVTRLVDSALKAADSNLRLASEMTETMFGALSPA
jgi:hypothetical protein